MVHISQQTTEVPQLPFVFRVVDAPVVQVVLAMPVVDNDSVRKVQTLQKTFDVPQLQFIKVVDISLS